MIIFYSDANLKHTFPYLLMSWLVTWGWGALEFDALGFTRGTGASCCGVLLLYGGGSRLVIGALVEEVFWDSSSSDSHVKSITADVDDSSGCKSEDKVSGCCPVILKKNMYNKNVRMKNSALHHTRGKLVSGLQSRTIGWTKTLQRL